MWTGWPSSAMPLGPRARQQSGRWSRSGGQTVTKAGAVAETWSWSSLTTKSAPRAWASWPDTGKDLSCPTSLPHALGSSDPSGPFWLLLPRTVPGGRGRGDKPLFHQPEKHLDGGSLSHKPLAERDTPTVPSLIPTCRVTRMPQRCPLARTPKPPQQILGAVSGQQWLPDPRARSGGPGVLSRDRDADTSPTPQHRQALCVCGDGCSQVRP